MATKAQIQVSVTGFKQLQNLQASVKAVVPQIDKANAAFIRLSGASNLEPSKKEVTLSDGSLFEMYVTPLTMAERERAQKQTKDDANAFALQLLMYKALDENGNRLFKSGEIDILKNEVKDSDLQKLMLAVIDEKEEDIDPKD